MVEFILMDDSNNIIKKYLLKNETKMIELKDMIVKEHYNNLGYVDLDFLLEKTKRTFGKFNLDPGVIPRTFDNRSFENFGLENDSIKFKVSLYDKNPQQIKKQKIIKSSDKSSKYIPPKLKQKINSSDKFIYNEDDFPNLSW